MNPAALDKAVSRFPLVMDAAQTWGADDGATVNIVRIFHADIIAEYRRILQKESCE